MRPNLTAIGGVSSLARSTTTATPAADQTSGPHTTSCGIVSFTYDTAGVAVDTFTSEPEYRFVAEGEGTEQVEVTWVEAEAEECRVQAKLEEGDLEITIE